MVEHYHVHIYKLLLFPFKRIIAHAFFRMDEGGKEWRKRKEGRGLNDSMKGKRTLKCTILSHVILLWQISAAFFAAFLSLHKNLLRFLCYAYILIEDDSWCLVVVHPHDTNKHDAQFNMLFHVASAVVLSNSLLGLIWIKTHFLS